MGSAHPRSLAGQDVSALGGRLSVLTRQQRDHVRLDALLDELSHAAPARQDAVLRQIYRLVFPHAFAEEAVLWPVLRRLVPDGPSLTLAIEQEHQEVNELVTRLEDLSLDDGERRRLLDRLARVLREDVRDEEDRLLPQLQHRVSPSRLRALGLAWEAVRRIAPTRAHPVVARRPPGNVLAALPLSVLDRGRDVVDALLQSRAGRGSPGLERVSRGLTRASHVIERAPLLRSGEDSSTSRP